MSRQNEKRQPTATQRQSTAEQRKLTAEQRQFVTADGEIPRRKFTDNKDHNIVTAASLLLALKQDTGNGKTRKGKCERGIFNTGNPGIAQPHC